MRLLRIKTDDGQKFWAKSLADVRPEKLDCIRRVVTDDLPEDQFKAVSGMPTSLTFLKPIADRTDNNETAAVTDAEK